MKNLVLVLITLAGLSVCAQTASTVVRETSQAAIVSRGTDVVRLWQPGQHLYVKGNLGVSAASLDALEQWLDTNATNWAVVLVETAQGERYTDAEGNTFEGIEAVNHALGKGLMNQTAFGQQVDSRTQERNAAFLLLFLKERKLSYYGSDAQDRRGLGEDHWNGNLDQPAVSAMRNGARVVDAVKDSISQIDRRLQARITGEIEQSQKQAAAQVAARNRAVEQAKAALENAQADYNLLEAKSGEVARQSVDLTGDLVRPDLAGLRAELMGGQTALAQGDAAQAQRAADAVRQRAQSRVRLLEQYAADRQKVNALAKTLEHQKTRPLAEVAGRQLSAASAAVESTLRAYEHGDSSYVALSQGAVNALATVDNAITSAQRLAAQRRVLLGMALFSSLAAAAVVALLLNRRRLPAKTQATQLYGAWEKALGEKTTALFELLDRRGDVFGASLEDAALRYTGETLRLSRQSIQDVDELLIMSSCAGRVLERAEVLVHPKVLWPKVGNLFLARRYQRSIALLHDEPIVFRPEEGLELIVRGTRTDRDRLVGGLESYQPFTMTFNELITAFNQRAERALAALEQVQTGLMTGPDALKAVQKSIETTRGGENELATAGAQDGLYRLAPVFGELLPAAQRTLTAAVKLGISDPVGALQTTGAQARQQADDAAALVRIARETREKIIPSVRASALALTNSGVDSGWLELELSRLSILADSAANRALEASAAGELADLREGLARIESRGRGAVELDQRRREQSQLQVTASSAAIESARREIGAGLGKTPGEVIREAGRDPSEFVAQAQAQLDASVAALQRGDLEAARNSLDAVQALTEQADAIVAASREAFGKQSETLAALRLKAQRVGQLIPDHAAVLAEIQGGYAPTVLSLGAGDLAHPNANGTVADNIEESETHLHAAQRALDKSAAVFAQARVLEAADLLRQATALLETAQHRLAEIAEKKNRLVQTDMANRQKLEELDRRGAECARLAGEATAMVPTVEACREAADKLEAARAEVQAAIRDPFLAAESLDCVARGFEAVADQARCDRDLHEQAGRSLAAAAAQLTAAQAVAMRAATDRVPDSLATQQALAEVASLGGLLQAARQRHALAHGDWPALDQEANGVGSRAATATAVLRGELEQAQRAVSSLSAASASVRSAGGWTGGWGVRILGVPGSGQLSQAQACLERGDYGPAIRLAETARRAAEQAIAEAEAEVTRRRIEEEARRERERRRREEEEEERRRRSSSSSSGSSSSHSSSWGHSGSGSRTSSFSSGSGVSTSSW